MVNLFLLLVGFFICDVIVSAVLAWRSSPVHKLVRRGTYEMVGLAQQLNGAFDHYVMAVIEYTLSMTSCAGAGDTAAKRYNSNLFGLGYIYRPVLSECRKPLLSA